MGNIFLEGGRVIDPASNFDQIADIQIIGSKIANVGKISKRLAVGEIIDCHGKVVCPGLVDIHVHSRVPGQEKKENLGSVSFAAIMGGFTTIVCMANTSPVVDNVETLRLVQATAEAVDKINIKQVTAITKGLAGKEFVDLLAMQNAGAIAASDDGQGLQNPRVLLGAIEDFLRNGLPILLHCQDSRFDTYDPRAEIHQASMSLKIAEEFKQPIHLQHVSTAQTVQLVREAKARGAQVSCETAPHYFSLTEKDFRENGANFKMNPPLRKEKDRQAVIRGLADGTIDAIATDHAPHTPEEKAQGIEKAPFGVIGLETAVPVTLTTLSNRIPIMEIIRKMTINPARILKLEGKGTLHLGSVADITVIDPQMRQKVEADKFQSLSRNCPWNGKRLQGWPWMTICGGRILMKEGKLNI